jgi:hypothetical protein
LVVVTLAKCQGIYQDFYCLNNNLMQESKKDMAIYKIIVYASAITVFAVLQGIVK